MSDVPTVAPVESAPPQATEPQAPAMPEPEAPMPAAEPLSPGEAAKAARVRAEERDRLKRLKAKTDAFHKEKQAFAAERETWQQTAARKYEEQIAAMQAEMKALREGNPLKRPGVDVTATIQEYLDGNSPEARVNALEKQLKEQAEAHEKRWAEVAESEKARKAEDERRALEWRQRDEDTRIHGAAHEVSTKKELVERFKYLNVVYDTGEIAGQIRAVVEAARERNKGTNHPGFTIEQIVSHLEKQAEKVYTARKERDARIFGATPAAPPGAVPQASPPKAAIGNGSAARAKQSQARQLTREEEEAIDLAALRRATQADRIANAPSKK